MQIPIQNNNSSNGKKLTASEEELIEVPVVNYFDAKTYNKNNMTNIKQELQSVPNSIKYGVVGIIIITAIIASYALSGESEADKVARIAKLDYQRQEQLKENEATRQATIDCDLAIKQEIGKDKEIVPCTARTLSGSTIIPKASAMESNSGTVTTASSVVPKGFQRTHKDEVIMESICSSAPNSPLCGKWELYARLQDITYSRYDKNSRIWEIMIGIAYAESHIGQNYTKDNVGGTCYGRNNWGGVKAKVLDSGKVIADQRLPDEYNCWLYKFDTIEDYWTTKVNIITQNYKACLSRDKPIECISGNYVGKPNVQEPNWIRNVASFLVTDEMMNVGQP